MRPISKFEALKQERDLIQKEDVASPIMKTINTIKSIPRYFKIAFIVISVVAVIAFLKTVKDFITPNATSCPPHCC